MTNPKAIDWGKLSDMLQMLGQFAPVLVGFVQQVIDAFKKKGLKAVGDGDCCPVAKECCDALVKEINCLNVDLLKLQADCCNKELCKEILGHLAKATASAMCLCNCDN